MTQHRGNSLGRTCGPLLALVLGLLLGATARAHAPHDVVDALAISPDFGTDGTLFGAFTLTNRRVFARSFDGGRSWLEVAPPMSSQIIGDISFSPAYATDKTAFIGTSKGGIYRTTNRGVTWEQVSLSPSVSAVTPSPAFAVDGTVLAATRAAAWLSVDGGDTWSQPTSGLTEVTFTVAGFSPDGATAFLGGSVLHASLDGGSTWAPLQVLPERMASLAVSPLDPTGQTLAISFGMNGGGVLVSTDGGATFDGHLAGLTDLRVNEVTFAADGTLFAATAEGGLFRSDPGLQPWTVGLDGLEELSILTDNHYTHVEPSPDYATDDTVFLGGFEGVFTSEDRGQTWFQEDIYTQRVNRLLVMSPGWAEDRTFFAGNYGGGLYAHAPATGAAGPAGGGAPGPVSGQTAVAGDARPATPAGPGGYAPAPDDDPAWRALSTGVGTYSGLLTLSPGYPTDRTMFYGYSGLYRSEDDGATWTQIPKPPVVVSRWLALSPDFANDGIALLGSSQLGSWRSDDGIQSWEPMVGGLPFDLITSRIVMSPDFAASGLAYMATDQGVWRTDDKGLTWSLTAMEENVRCLEMSPSFLIDDLLFAGTIGQGLFRSDDAGATWQAVTTGLPPVPGLVVEDVALSPDFAVDGTAFLCALGEGVFRSTDGGDSWTDVSDDLPVDASRQIEVSPDFTRDRTVIHTNHDWVYISTDAGERWSRLPGFVRVNDRHQSARYEGDWAVLGASLPGEGEAAVEDCDVHHGPLARDRDPAPGIAAVNPGTVASLDHGKGTALSSTAGDSTWLRFYGDSVTWIGVRSPTGGRAIIAIDDVTVATVDLYAPATQHQRRIFTKQFPELGWHTIRVTNTGTAAPASSGIQVRSDGFEYTF